MKAGSTTKENVETRRFGMHPKLLLDVIKRQAGSLSKAVMEGVMNSIDAGAKKCEVTLTDRAVNIVDDGAGITERVHIEKFFETFGQPHDESEKKVYGTFRMGRGQMFAYGRNDWATGRFRMRVDVAERGLDYDLVTLHELESTKGCDIRIQLYERLSPGDLYETRETLERWLMYAQIPVWLDGKLITKDPAKQDWDHVTDEAYIKLKKTGVLELYNLGVHVMDIGAQRFGAGGTIVTRKQIKVNFARNDVQDSCPVWKKIKPLVNEKAKNALARKSTKLDTWEKMRIIDLINTGEWSEGLADKKVFSTCNGKDVSPAGIVRLAREEYGNIITACREGDALGDRLLQSKKALPLSLESTSRLKAKPEDWPALFKRLVHSHGATMKYGPFAELTKGISLNLNLVAEKDLTPLEFAWLNLIERAMGCAVWYQHRHSSKARRIAIGEGKGAAAWTNGSDYIAIERSYLKGLSLGAGGFTSLAGVICHEMAHEDSTEGGHVHSPEFYERYHDLTLEIVGAFTDAAIRIAPVMLTGALVKRKIKRLLKDADKRHACEAALESALASLKDHEEEA